ncbi:uncharacterized protein K444DRAFT_586963 [Hyaloscypha bicolor E]|uniref:Ricin B lectin domain-containing protein n=1 Tax=Hyaloscypha bicolor E TaxID=1095630 RepID=A0A2J6TGK9_9HELO|nr:uncharacterized protein K444DRAFT_586963 [Hyaloscypha bicolor E]PMD62145.1 hypothetical protein K444DRAFT_586963 [Hyaloscypha bicolor E]
MIASLSLLLSSVALSFASPLGPIEARTVAALNTAAFEEAQQRDATATRAFSGIEITTSTGQCLFINELSGDFRANLNPIQAGTCDGSQGQLWDVITKGKHDDQAGTMLLVNTLTQACMNFDPRRAAGNTVIMFSCGGRADGGGAVTNSQLFAFAGGAGPLALQPKNAAGTCLTVTSGNVLDQAPCNTGDAKQAFSFSGGGAASAPASTTALAVSSISKVAAVVAATSNLPAVAQCNSVTTVFVTRAASSAGAAPATSNAAAASSATSPVSAPAVSAIAGEVIIKTDTSNPSTPVPVSGAGGTLQPSSAAEANKRDDTATRAFTGVSLKAANGQCLFINPTAGDFRQNLVPVNLQPCTGSLNEKFDLITAGIHNNTPNTTLVVSSLMQGCISFDPRRADPTKVQVFACGGRGDGSGQVSNSQQFPFGGGNSILLAPLNSNGQTCLTSNATPNPPILDQGACNGNADQLFTIAQ